MKAAIYARYSTDRQNDTSIADQLRVCREYAARKGWTVTAEHADEGISGTALGNRPEVLSLLKSAMSGHLDALIVIELWRLARSEDLPQVIRRLKFRQVLVIGIQDGFESTARTARMQAGMAGMMGAEFCEMVSLRTHSALEMRAKNGQATGGKAYENPEVVKEIFTRFAAGESMKAIASDFNRRGEPSPGAEWKARARPRGNWQISTLHTMLHNERYIGRLVWNKSQWVKDPDTGKRIRRERPQSEWIVKTCDRMVDDETWRRVQSRFVVRRGKGGGPRWLLSGILECAECSGKMIIMGGDQHRYICGTNHSSGEHACANGSTFPRETAERLILAPVMDDLLSPAAIAEGVRMMREERAAPPKPEPPDRELLELERLVKMGVLSADTAGPSIAEARRKAEARRRAEPIPLSPWPTERAWRDTVASMREILTGADITAAREVLKQLIGPARCRPAVNGHVVVELTTRHVLLATSSRSRTGTDDRRVCGSVDGSVAGPRYQPIYWTVEIPVSSCERGSLDSDKVHNVRTSGLTDSHLARQNGVSVATIRDARVGNTWRDHPTPPDTAPREGGGRKAGAQALKRRDGSGGAA